MILIWPKQPLVITARRVNYRTPSVDLCFYQVYSGLKILASVRVETDIYMWVSGSPEPSPWKCQLPIILLLIVKYILKPYHIIDGVPMVYTTMMVLLNYL